MKVIYPSLVILPLLAFVCHSNGTLEQIQSANNVIKMEEVVVELAIFCDSSFSSSFKGDFNKLVKYWGALIWDLQLKFQTVQKINISYRVNSIITLQADEEQQFIEPLRSTDESLPALEILSSFEDWLHNKSITKNFTSYDVAVLAVNSQLSGGDILGMANIGQACDSVENTLVLTMHQRHIGDTLAHEIAHILNAPHDDADDYEEYNCGNFNPLEHNFLMASGSEGNLQQYVFSPCSQKFIHEFVQEERANCLRRIDASITPVIDTKTNCDLANFFGGTSLNQQCQILSGVDSAFVSKDVNDCAQVQCNIASFFGIFTLYRNFYPFDGTKCGQNDKGHCLWGSCVYHDHQLVNVATEQCLESIDPFSNRTDVKLTNCLAEKRLTPLGSFILEAVDNLGVQIKILGVSGTQYTFGDRCLTFLNEGFLNFESCTEVSSEATWEVLFTSDNLNESSIQFTEFVLRNRVSGQCLIALENDTVLKTTPDCSIKDSRQRWRYVKNNEILSSLKCTGKTMFENVDDAPSASLYPQSSILMLVLCFVRVFIVL